MHENKMGSVIFAIFYLFLTAMAVVAVETRVSMEADVVSPRVASKNWIMGARTPGTVKLRFTAALRIKPENARIHLTHHASTGQNAISS